MSGFICARCLARPLQQPVRLPIINAISKRSTSDSSKKAVTPSWKLKGKGGPAKTSRAVGVGERKAARKRVVLSNVNAREVSGLQVMNENNAFGEEHQGQMVALPDNLIDALRANEAFKATQKWHLFRRPATLMREDTKRIASMLNKVESSPKGRPTVLRRIVTGSRGSGKSVLQLQAMSMALLKGWIVIHIPDPNAMTNGSTSYAPDGYAEEGEQQSYIQPDATTTLLTSIAAANKPILSSLTLTQTHNLPIPIQPNISLHQFAQLGTSDPLLAWPIYQSLWRELTAPGRPPILYTLDGLSHFLVPTGYTAPDMSKIHALDFRLPQQALSLLTGSTPLPNGGLVLLEDSTSNRPRCPALDFAVRRANVLSGAQIRRTGLGAVRQALEGVDGKGVPVWNPLVAVDRRAMDALVPDAEGRKTGPYEVFEVGGLSREETRALLEYHARSGLYSQRIDAGSVGEKWALSGGGIIGEVERACLARM